MYWYDFSICTVSRCLTTFDFLFFKQRAEYVIRLNNKLACLTARSFKETKLCFQQLWRIIHLSVKKYIKESVINLMVVAFHFIYKVDTFPHIIVHVWPLLLEFDIFKFELFSQQHLFSNLWAFKIKKCLIL